MAYNNAFPMTCQQQMYPQYSYQPQFVQQPQQVMQQPQVVQNNDNGILWVQGEAGAKSWAVAPGKSVMLMDSESNTFYIKSSDASGMPMPLRIFDYKERTTANNSAPAVAEKVDLSRYVTWDELEAKLEAIRPHRNKVEEVVVDG